MCLVILFILAVWAGPALAQESGSEAATATSATPEPAASSTGRTTIGSPILSSANSTAALSANIDTLVESQSGVYGVVVIDPLGSTIYARNATVPFISASLYKLPLMAKIYQLIENGDVSLDQPLTLEEWYFMVNEGGDSYYDDASASSSTTVKEALFASGAYSSNVGALALTSLTDWAAIQSMAQVLGMMGSYLTVDLSSIPQWPPQLVVTDSAADLDTAVAFVESEAQSGPIMLTTPADIAHFFDLLLKGEVVSESASASIYQILDQQAVTDRIPQLLPSNTKTVHKTGNLDQVVHDAGIIYTARGPVILAALVQADPDDAQATLVIQQLARMVFDLAPLSS
jgi:beta-lactamase class A